MTAFKVGENDPAIILSNMQNARPAIWFTDEDVRKIYDHFQKKDMVFMSEPCDNKLRLTDYSKEGK